MLEFRNRILKSLPQESLALIAEDLEEVALPVRKSLVEPTEKTQFVYFLEDGLASVVADTQNTGKQNENKQIEIGHIGFEGMSGFHLVLGVDRTPVRTFMQVAGRGLCLSAEHLTRAMGQDEKLKAHLLRYIQTYQLQLAYSALANARYTIPERLARWLLMCHDRLGNGPMRLTHEFLALMLGVRRSGVTNEIHILEGNKAIRATRATILILNRGKLEEMAGGIYGVPEIEYARLIEEVGTLEL